MTKPTLTKFLALSFLGLLVFAASCGGGSSPATTPPQTITGTGSNVVAISVNGGPQNNYPDAAFVSVTVCAPGSTTNCQVIPDVLVDTGSTGLRILGSALGSVTLTQATVNGNSLAECYAYADGSFNWGPVQTADVQIGGESGSSVPVQVMDDAFSAIPSATCTGMPVDTQTALGANGILGVGPTQADCGTECTGNIPAVDQYYVCTNAGCQVSGVAANVQVQNPIGFFGTDNNGVIIELPALTAPAATLAGSMVFGIGTESNNALGSATVVEMDPSNLIFTTNFESTSMTDSFIDSGSNGLFFDSNSNSLPECTDVSYYCPTTTQGLSATNSAPTGLTGSATVSFNVLNGDLLFSANEPALPGLAAPANSNGTSFDWGLPFFFGRNVYTSIEGTTAPGGTTPYWAYPPN